LTGLRRILTIGGDVGLSPEESTEEIPAAGQDPTRAGLRARLERLRSRLGPPRSYWLTRFVILRLLGVVYFFAFLSLATQVLPLIGSNGLLPAGPFMQRVELYLGSGSAAFGRLPSLFWLDASDPLLATLAWVGLGLSILLVLGFANAILLIALWALYMSYVHIGQDWYGYGWEIQLLETGFLAAFLCPLVDPRPFPRRPPPVPVIWLFRWLTFRIMLGAGLIKIRGDECWRDLTCLYYHYETQPIPNPLSRYLHFMPKWFHRGGVLWNHVCELIAPWFGFGPRHIRHLAGVLMVTFQIILILSGNLSFLNYLTIVPMIACLDDSFLRRFLPGALVRRAERAAARAESSPAQSIAVGLLVIVVAVLSFYPVRNLFSSRQAMNTSFDRLNLVNTYGAFGSVGKERHEIVFEGTDDTTITGSSVWKEYEFKAKPGDPVRRPAIIAPYQPRLDWQIWFAAMSGPDRYPWTVHLIWKLLHGDAGALSLLASNPFPDHPPRYIRASYYRYEFAPPGNPEGVYWRRTPLGIWIPPLSADDERLQRFLMAHGWLAGPSRP
jgi:Lipase maturation factor